MGAIVSDFPELPIDSIGRIGPFSQVFNFLDRRGQSPGWDPSTVTRAVVLADLQTYAGKLIQDEMLLDPEGRGYAGLTDQQAANRFQRQYFDAPSKIDGANNQGYRALVGSTDLGCNAERWQNGGGPNFVNVIGDNEQVYVRFRPQTLTVALQRLFIKVQHVTDATTLNFAARLPAAVAADDRFDLVNPRGSKNPPRSVVILGGLPFVLNELTAADIAAARTI